MSNRSNLARAIALFAATAVVAACSSAPSGRVTHLDEHTEHVGVNVLSVVSQTDIAAADDEHAHSLLGQAAALFEFNAKQTKTQPPHMKLRDALTVVDVRNELAKNLSTDLAKGAPFTVASVEPRDALPADLPQRVATLSDSGLLLLDTIYFMTPNMRAMRVETHVTLYNPTVTAKTKSGKIATSTKPGIAYNNVLVAHQEAPHGLTDNKALDYWLQNDGRRGIDTLRSALNEIARLLVWDLNDRQQLVKKISRMGTFTVASSERSGSTEIKGMLVMETVSRYLVRASDGKLYSLPNPNYREPTVAQ